MAKRVLLTGANGFLGSHILSLLLKSSYSVRAIVRSQSKADQVRKDFPEAGASLSFGIVPDITTPHAFDSVVISEPPFDAVIHTASPYLYAVASNNLKDFLEPAVKGTEEILKSIHSHAPSVKRVVITSSMAAVLDFDAGNNGKIYTEKDWNPTTWEQAMEGNLGTGYRGSKKFAEKAAWSFIEKQKPDFDLVVLNPPMIYGPLAHTIPTIASLNESNKRIYDLFINTSPTADIPPNGLYLYVDVRDIAHAHILALSSPAASNRRFLISAGQISSLEIADILRSEVPGLKDRTPRGKAEAPEGGTGETEAKGTGETGGDGETGKGGKGGKGLPEGAFDADNGEGRRVLGVGYRGKEETFGELGRQLVGIERGG